MQKISLSSHIVLAGADVQEFVAVLHVGALCVQIPVCFGENT